jgi:hypothetical protein
MLSRYWYYTTLHYTTLHRTVPYYTILYYTILYYTILYWCRRKGQYLGRWQYRSLWENKMIWSFVQFWTVTEMELFESPGLTLLRFCLWGWIMNEVHKKKGEYTTWIALSHSGCCCLHKETWSAQNDQQAILVSELRSALTLTVGMSNIYSEL